MTSRRFSDAEFSDEIMRRLTAMCAAYGFEGPKRVASEYSVVRDLRYVRLYFGKNLVVDFSVRIEDFRWINSHLENVVDNLAIDDRIEITHG